MSILILPLKLIIIIGISSVPSIFFSKRYFHLLSVLPLSIVLGHFLLINNNLSHCCINENTNKIYRCFQFKFKKITGNYKQLSIELTMDNTNPESQIDNRNAQSNADLNNFDQVPIGGGNKFAISEFAEGVQPQTPISTQNMSLQQKIYSKVVKIKLQGLDELKNIFTSHSAPQFQVQMGKILKQNNPACLQKALQCAQKWIQINKNWSDKQAKQIIQNGCINGKGNTKKLSSEIIFRMFQLKPQTIQQTIIESGLKAKTPKIIGGYLCLLNELLQQFGIKDLKYLKPYLSNVVKALNNQKLPIVKQQGMGLIKAGFKWLGKDFLWTIISDLKQNMKKQLQSFWEGHDKKQVMKANRQKNNSSNECSTQGAKQKNGTKTFQKQDNQVVGNGIDIYQISDPIQIFQKFDQKWSQTVLETQKWNQKTALLQQLIMKASVPKINNSEHRHITQMIRRLLNDSNFNVVLSSLKLAGTLAKGLRKNFNHSAKILFSYITPKFRDKKTQMIQQTSNTLNNFYYCLSFQQVGEDVKAALKDKSSGMKTNIIKWMISQIQRKVTQNANLDKIMELFKSNSFQTIIQGLINDPTSQVRDSSVKLVIKAKGIFGELIFKNIDKTINNKDLLNKLNDGIQVQENLAKSRSKQNISGKKAQRSGSKPKSTKGGAEQQEQLNKKSYSIKANNQGQQTIDITQQLNKHMKKLNDNTNWQNRKDSAQKLIRYFTQLEKENPSAKISSSILHDFVGVLKARISDPNKQLIKIFVNLVGEVFRCIGDKQLKIHSKIILQQLIQAFSDKNQINRKQIFKTLDRISVSTGAQGIIGYIGQILTQDTASNSANSQLNSVSKQYVLQYLYDSEFFMNKIQQLQNGQNLKQLKDYPKIVLAGMCDKNKDLRIICEKVLKLISEKCGIQVFRKFVNSKDQKSTFKQDLNNYLDKLENQSNNQQPSMISNNSFLSLNNPKQNELSRKRSPSINQSKIKNQNGNQKIRRKVSNVTSLNSSRSKNKYNSVIIIGQQIQKAASHITKEGRSRLVQGNEVFANLSLLTYERVQREENASRYRNNIQNHPIFDEALIQQSLQRLVNYEDLYLKMYSMDYRKNIDVTQKIIKMCKDVTYTNSIRQVWDLILKWVVIKMHGGSVACLPLIEVVCPLLTVLEKKKIAWTDYDIDVIIFLTRQYSISSYFEGCLNLQTLKNIIKMATALSSGQRMIKKILIQMKNDLAQQHRFLYSKKEGISFSVFYKKIMSQICGYFVDYFSHNGLLQEAATIPELSQNHEFIKLLTNKFHQGVLRQFGFNLDLESNLDTQFVKIQKQLSNTQKSNKVPINTSRSVSPSPVTSTVYILGKQNKNQKLEDPKSQKKTPQKLINVNNSYYQNHLPPTSPISRSNFAGTNIINSPSIQETMYSAYYVKKSSNVQQLYKNIGLQLQSDKYDIDLSQFKLPSNHNPLGSNLLKLFPYNESAVHFFSTILQPQNQSSQKIASELSTNANVIYGYMFNTLVKVMQISVRQSQGPDKIISFMNLVQQSIKCSNIFKNLSEEVIQKSMRYTIDQLVYQDENRTAIQNKLRSRGYNDFRGDGFIKGINSIMLRILDNAPPLLLINSLLLNLVQTMINNKNGQQIHTGLPIINKNKKIGLLIRCLGRTIGSYFFGMGNGKQKEKQSHLYNIQQDPSCMKTNHVFNFILISKQYLDILQISDLVDFEGKESLKMEKSRMSNITTSTQQSIAFSICKIFKFLHRKNLIGKVFESVKKQNNHMKDEKIISQYLNHINDLSTSFMGMTGVLGNCNYKQQVPSQIPQIDEQLKKVIQLLSKIKTFSEGIKMLKQYIQQCGGRFDYKNCFLKMNFQISFIEKVTEQLNKLTSLAQQNSHRTLNPDIQDKLQRLKMKIQGINSDNEGLAAQKNIEKIDKLTIARGNYIAPTHHSTTRGVVQNKTPNARETASKSIEGQISNQNDIKKRIEDMKNKVNLSTMNRMR